MLKRNGFSLIEVLIVIAIVSILAGIAVSVYSKEVEKTRLADARSALTQDFLFMGRWYANHGNYYDSSNHGWPNLPAPNGDVSNFFTFKFLSKAASVDSNTYTIVATPISKRISEKHLRIDQDGTLRVCTGDPRLVDPQSCRI